MIVRADMQGSAWMLRHEVLTPRIRVLGAPARAAARRAFDLLGSKIQNKTRLTLMELYSLRHEGITPSSPAEVGVVQRSKRYYMMIAGAIAAVPIVILILILMSMRGRVFFDLEPAPGGDHVLVRGGRAGLSSFGWLPGSGYGKVIADTGLTRAMVAPEMWKKIDAHDLGTDKGDWGAQLKAIMAPQLAGLVDYATTGSRADARGTEEGGEGSRGPRRAAHGTSSDRARYAGRDRARRVVARDAESGRAARGGRGRRCGGAAPRRLSRHAREGADVAGRRASPHRVLVGAQPRRARQGAVLGGARTRSRCSDPPRAAAEVSAAATDDAPSATNAIAVLVRCRIVAAAQGAREGADPQRTRAGCRSPRAPR